jgi:hypothetical protein
VPARGLHTVGSWRHAPLQGAWRGQALPAQGMLQGSCCRRHAVLQRARRRQAVPRGGLPQGSCYRRDASLHRARRRQALPAGGLLQASRSTSRQHALHAVSAAHTAAARRCGGAATLSTRAGTQCARARGDPAAGGGLRVNQFTAEAKSGLLIGGICVRIIAITYLRQPVQVLHHPLPQSHCVAHGCTRAHTAAGSPDPHRKVL